MVTETVRADSMPPEAAANRILAVRNLTKSFGATRALLDVSLDFLEGEIHCLLGENGAGKSTIGKIIGGLYSADDGQLLFDGKPVALNSIRDARALGIAIVYQELSLAPDLSVRANLCLGTEGVRNPFVRLRHQSETARTVAVLRKLGLDIDIEQKVRDLPAATQQLVEIGKALMQSPRLVVFDEPTAMLGAVEKRKLFDVLRTLRATGTASVMITHHIDDVMAVGDRISIMRNGKLIDSFPLDASIDGDVVLERLTGKKMQVAPAKRKSRGAGACLHIDNVFQRDGTPASVTAQRGEIVGFYGVVGCGAEKIVQGLVGLGNGQPLSFVIDGKPYQPRGTVQALAQGVSYLPSGRASNGILATRSIRENLNLTQLSRLSKIGVVSKQTERDRTAATLRRFTVKYGDAEHLITSLSGGNQQKVLLARAIARAQKILVLEEPTAGIDIEAKHEIHARIRELASQGVTVILASSDLLETIALCDVVFTMYGGKVMRQYVDPQLDDQGSIIADVLGQNVGMPTAPSEQIALN